MQACFHHPASIRDLTSGLNLDLISSRESYQSISVNVTVMD